MSPGGKAPARRGARSARLAAHRAAGLPVRRRVAVFDLDGTLTRHDLFLSFLAAAARRFGPARPVRALGLPILTGRYFLRGISNDRLKEAFLDAMLGGRPRATLEAFAAEFADRVVARDIKPAALASLRRHREAGHLLVLASASLDLYVEPVAARLGFDAAVATRIAWTEEGRVGGTLAGANLRGPSKLVALRALLAERFPGPFAMTAYSDHESDVPLLAAADTAVAVDPTRALRDIAQARRWRIAEWKAAPAAAAGGLLLGEGRPAGT